MKDSSMIIWASLLLCGCASSGRQIWITDSQTDQFTDITTKTVRMNAAIGYYSRNSMQLFISVRTNQLIVGVQSLIGIPVGTVHLRVDGNPAWEISPAETPLYLQPSVPKVSSAHAALQEEIASNFARIMSPFTAAAGEKAGRIVMEMFRGSNVQYRTIGINQPASSTGFATLGEPFREALQSIGVSTNTIPVFSQ